MGKKGGKKSVESRFKNLTSEQISMRMRNVRNKTMTNYTEQEMKYAELGCEKLFHSPTKLTIPEMVKTGKFTEKAAMDHLIMVGEAFAKAEKKSK